MSLPLSALSHESSPKAMFSARLWKSMVAWEPSMPVPLKLASPVPPSSTVRPNLSTDVTAEVHLLDGA